VNQDQPDWAVAALYQIGCVYKEYARSLMKSEIPYFLEEKHSQHYKNVLVKKADKYNDKAIDSFERALFRAKKGKIKGKYVEQTLLELRKLLPEEYKKVWINW